MLKPKSSEELQTDLFGEIINIDEQKISNSPVEINEDGTSLLLYEKDLPLDANFSIVPLINWTEFHVFSKTITHRNRTVEITGAPKSNEQLQEELKRNKKSNPEITSIKHLNKQFPICADFEARMYFAILKLFYDKSKNNEIPMTIITTYQEIKDVMGIPPTFSTKDLKESLFRVAHTRYDFKDSYVMRTDGDNMASVKKSHSLYLLKYYELEISNLKEKLEAGEIFEDFEIIEKELRKLLKKQGRPTVTMLKIVLDEEQWKNIVNGYNLLYSFEHLNTISKANARGLYLFLDPHQGYAFTTGKIVKTNKPNVFTVKAEYIVDYLGSNKANASRSIKGIKTALEILKEEGYIKEYSFITNTRKILDGVFTIDFFPQQSRDMDNKYGSFMIKGNTKALTAIKNVKRQLDLDYEQILSNVYTLVGGERLLTKANLESFKTIYYDDKNIEIAHYLNLPLDKTYGYYNLMGIMYGVSLTKPRNINKVIHGIIIAESSQSKNQGYSSHAITLMEKDFILKYGQTKLDEARAQAINNLSFNNKNLEIEKGDEDIWDEFIEFYKLVYETSKKNARITEFNTSSKLFILSEYKRNKFFAVALVNYVLIHARDLNAYIIKHHDKPYVLEQDALNLQTEYEKKQKVKEKKHNESLVSQNKSDQIKSFQTNIEEEFNKLSPKEKKLYTTYTNSLVEKYGNKINNLFKKDTLIYSVYAVSKGKSYNKLSESLVMDNYGIDLELKL